MEFWATVDMKASREQLEEQLALWQSFYNGERTHSSLNSKTPNQRFQEVQELVPSPHQIKDAYTPPRWNINNSHGVWVFVGKPKT